MHQRRTIHAWFAGAVLLGAGIHAPAYAEEHHMQKPNPPLARDWRAQAAAYARIMSQVQWTPAAGGMPVKGGKRFFQPGMVYTGTPYSSVKSVGRYIGFDIFLKTFLAAVENPLSILYTENLGGKVENAGCYYGKVCSSFTSYALQCGFWYVSLLHTPPYRDGIDLVAPQSAQAAAVGDIIYTPETAGSHVELVADLVRDADGAVTHVRVEDSWPATTRSINHTAAAFDRRISTAGRRLYRITDLSAWRGENRAESFLFPNYAEDSAKPVINRELLLDRGDWVPYQRGQPVRINVMDRDSRGVVSLVIKRGDAVIETLAVPGGRGVFERALNECGDYTAHCVLADGSLSQPCEFSVCDIAVRLPQAEFSAGADCEVEFSAANMQVIYVFLVNPDQLADRHILFVSQSDRDRGRLRIPGRLLATAGPRQIWVAGEHRYGRLTVRRDITVAAPPDAAEAQAGAEPGTFTFSSSADAPGASV